MGSADQCHSYKDLLGDDQDEDDSALEEDQMEYKKNLILQNIESLPFLWKLAQQDKQLMVQVLQKAFEEFESQDTEAVSTSSNQLVMLMLARIDPYFKGLFKVQRNGQVVNFYNILQEDKIATNDSSGINQEASDEVSYEQFAKATNYRPNQYYLTMTTKQKSRCENGEESAEHEQDA